MANSRAPMVQTKQERREGQLRNEKVTKREARPLEWTLEGDVIEGAAGKNAQAKGSVGSGLNSSDILCICFLPDGQGFGACLVGSGDGNIYIYDQAESSEQLPDHAYLPIEKRISNRLKDKNKRRKRRKTKPKRGILTDKVSEQNTKFMVKNAEDANLKLEWVYGFYDTGTSNVRFSSVSGSEITYPAAGVAVVYNFERREQRFFTRHTDDVISIATEPAAELVATGEVGKTPKTIVWSCKDMQVLAVLSGYHLRGVQFLAFSPTDTDLLVTVGMDDDQMVAVYNWRKGKIVAEGKGGKQKIYGLVFDPDGEEFVTFGMKHIKFWDIDSEGKKMTSENGKFGRICSPQPLHCAAFCYPNGKGDGKPVNCVTGAEDGRLIEWDDDKAIDAVEGGHTQGPGRSGACTTIYAYDKGIVSGGNDGRVILWTHQLEITFIFDLKGAHVEAFDVLVPEIRSVSVANRLLVVAVRSGDIVSVDLQKVEASGEVSVSLLMDGHFGQGELWGLDTHPFKSIFVTCSDDATVRSFDADEHKQISAARLSHQGRCAAYAPDGEHIAIGLKSGGIEVWDDELEHRIKMWQHSLEEISCIRYSPDGLLLAAGSKDNYIYLYNVGAEIYTKRAICKGHSSFITHLDWSMDSQVIQSVDGAHERLTWSGLSGKKMFGDRAKAARWHTYTCIRGKTVEGIWPVGADGTDINEACRSHGGWLVATSDDFGKVNTYKYPCYNLEDDDSSDDDEERRTCKKYILAMHPM